MTIRYKYITFQYEFVEPKEKYNIISCSIFRMIDNYKNEYAYINGMHRLLNQFETKFPDYYLRIYYDNSVLDYKTPKKIENTKKLYQPLFNKIKKYSKVQMVKYEMDKFKADEIHHKGVLGTLIRLYPLFDTEYNKNIENIMVVDIDMQQYEIDNLLKDNNKWLKSGVDFYYRTRNCYDLQDRFQILTKYFNIKFPIMAGTIMSKIKFPIDILDNFFECLLDKNKSECEYYKTFDEFSYSKYHAKYGINNEFKYGTDETLTMLIKEYLYKNKIKHMITIDWDISKPFYNMYSDYDSKKISEEQFANTLKYILGDVYNNKISLTENYNMIDNIIYSKKGSNKLTEKYILDKAKQLINDIKNNKLNKNDYGFSDDVIDCIENTEYIEHARKYYIINYINKFTKDNIQKIEYES